MTTDNASQDARQMTAGERLRQAREAAGLSVTEVADRQHLRPTVIIAIEKGDYRQVDSELFLKGYVRAYASQVGIDPDSVVRQLDTELEPLREQKKAQVEANPLVTIERRKRRKRQVARVVFVLVLLAAIFYGGSLYLAHQQAEEQDVEQPDSEQLYPEQPEISAEPIDVTMAPEETGDTDAEAVDRDTAEPTENVSPADASEGDTSGTTGQEEAEPVTATEPATAGEEEIVALEPGTVDMGSDPVPTPTITEEPESTPAPPPVQETNAPEGEQSGRLVASFSDDCWVEVQDSNGRVLVAALFRAGETLNVSGDDPLRVVFGAVDAVSSVQYEGEPVDLSSRQARNNRVVLTLSE